MNSKKGLKTLGVLVSTFTVFFSLTTWAQNYGGDRVGRANGGQYSSRYLPPVLPPRTTTLSDSAAALPTTQSAALPKWREPTKLGCTIL